MFHKDILFFYFMNYTVDLIAQHESELLFISAFFYFLKTIESQFSSSFQNKSILLFERLQKSPDSGLFT